VLRGPLHRRAGGGQRLPRLQVEGVPGGGRHAGVERRTGHVVPERQPVAVGDQHAGLHQLLDDAE